MSTVVLNNSIKTALELGPTEKFNKEVNLYREDAVASLALKSADVFGGVTFHKDADFAQVERPRPLSLEERVVSLERVVLPQLAEARKELAETREELAEERRERQKMKELLNDSQEALRIATKNHKKAKRVSHKADSCFAKISGTAGCIAHGSVAGAAVAAVIPGGQPVAIGLGVVGVVAAGITCCTTGCGKSCLLANKCINKCKNQQGAEGPQDQSMDGVLERTSSGSRSSPESQSMDDAPAVELPSTRLSLVGKRAQV